MTAPQLLDADRLLAFINHHMNHGSTIRRAIYEGLHTRITRGDYNHTDEEQA